MRSLLALLVGDELAFGEAALEAVDAYIDELEQLAHANAETRERRNAPRPAAAPPARAGEHLSGFVGWILADSAPRGDDW